MQNIPNNWGYKMQEEGHYQNYFEVIDIEISLTKEQKERLKKEPQIKTCDSFLYSSVLRFYFS